jgi:molybdate transport system regulatory protein
MSPAKRRTTRPTPAPNANTPAVRLRVLADSVIAMGPGKADLLEAIEAHGSISAAARAMGMSYRRAWLLVHTMNTAFRAPLVESSKGGAEGGHASLTADGRRVLVAYRDLSARAAKTFAPLLAR